MGSKSKKKKQKLTAVERGDVAIADAFEPVRKTPAAERVFGAIAELGDQPPLYAMTGAVIVTGAAMRDWRLTRSGARMMAAHAVATTIKTIMKLSIDRTRPHMAAENGQYEMREGRRYEPDYNSFPSGHTASSIAVARALGRDHPGQHGLALAAASTVAALQVVRNKHFLSDIVAGMAIGLAAEKMVDLVFRRYPARPA
jgi:membrane-associated phospholipid phosphatase